jgi:hypothetical protein
MKILQLPIAMTDRWMISATEYPGETGKAYWRTLWRYSAIVSPVPPASTGKSLSLGRPSRMGSTVSA